MLINLRDLSAYFISFITFIGFYVIIVIVLFLGFEQTRYFTIPTRLLVTIVILFNIYTYRFKIACNHFVYFSFISFFILYFFSVYIKTAFGTSLLNRNEFEIILYSLIYAVVPFFYFSERKTDHIYKIIFKAIVISGVFLSFACIYLYRDILLSGYSRISLAQYDVFYQIITPLSLSYSGALILGLTLSNLIFEKGTKKVILYNSIAFLFGLIPFILGASRGSVVALILPFIVIFANRVSTKLSIKTLIITFVFTFVTVYVVSYFGTGVFVRALTLLQDIQKGSSSAVRIEIWLKAIDGFVTSPIFGSSIGMERFSYPHNIIFEVLMATGMVGVIPFSMLLIYSIHKSFLILKYKPEYTWIVILFWQGLIQSLFSGALYNAIYFWGGMGLVTSVQIK